MRIIDTHLHLIDPERFSYDWLGLEPHLNRRWTAAEYWAEAEGLGVERAFHVEADVVDRDMLAETTAALALHPKMTGAIAAARPESFDFPQQLEMLAQIDGVLGIRRVLQSRPKEFSQTPPFVENVRRLAEHKLTFDICLKSHELALAVALVGACPDVQFVLDHCGNPRMAAQEWEPWASYIRQIADFPNVACKVSGLLANVAHDWTVDGLRPYFEHVVACFGWQRLTWGSDYPILSKNADLGTWIRATQQLIQFASEDERRMMLHRNAEQLYRYPTTYHA